MGGRRETGFFTYGIVSIKMWETSYGTRRHPNTRNHSLNYSERGTGMQDRKNDSAWSSNHAAGRRENHYRLSARTYSVSWLWRFRTPRGRWSTRPRSMFW